MTAPPRTRWSTSTSTRASPAAPASRVCPADAIELVYDVEGTPDEVFTHLAAAWVLDRPAGRQQLEQILGERAT
jgi:hypothetical protein